MGFLLEYISSYNKNWAKYRHQRLLRKLLKVMLHETIRNNHRRTGRGGAEGDCSPNPQILGNSEFLGSKRKFGQS